MKHKIIIFPHTLKRDAVSALILKGFLEKRNFDVQITSMINLEKWIRFWKPEILVIFSHGRAQRIKKKFNNLKIVFIDGEVFQQSHEDLAKEFFDDTKSFESLDLILVGSELSKRCFGKYNLDNSKVHVVGNTRFDTARFLLKKKITKRNGIGFASSFSLLNHHEGYSTIRGLYNDTGLKYGVTSVYGYNAFYRALIYILKNTDHHISIRPHPNEDPDSYQRFIIDRLDKKLQKKIDIDTSLDFTIWASKLKCIVAPTTTSIIQANLVGTPVFNILSISGQRDFWDNYAKSYKICNESSSIPSNFDDLKNKIKKAKPIKSIKKEVKKLLNEECDWNNDEYATYRSSNLIEQFSKNVGRNFLRIPKFICRFFEYYFFNKALRKKPQVQNFNYSEFFQSEPEEISKLINKRVSF